MPPANNVRILSERFRSAATACIADITPSSMNCLATSASRCGAFQMKLSMLARAAVVLSGWADRRASSASTDFQLASVILLYSLTARVERDVQQADAIGEPSNGPKELTQLGLL